VKADDERSDEEEGGGDCAKIEHLAGDHLSGSPFSPLFPTLGDRAKFLMQG
jgi:hypothetical protein